MDTPGLSQPKKKRDPEKNRINQKLYRQQKYAALNGIEDVKAHHRQRYYERMARMKANGEYEAFKAKKTKEGMQRYHAMSEEQRSEVKRKTLQFQQNWLQKMKDEGMRRRELQAEERRALGVEGWKALQKQKYEKRVQSIRRQHWQWLDEQLDRPFPLRGCHWTGPRRAGYKRFVPMCCNKWTNTCKKEKKFIKNMCICNSTCRPFFMTVLT